MTEKSRSTSRGSSEDVGSSMITTRCRSFTARATATVCWTPTLSSWSGRRDVDLDPVAGQDVACFTLHPPLVDEAEPVRRFVAQEEVLGRAHRGTRLISW